MGFRPQAGKSRGRLGFQRSSHEKAKAKHQKRQSGGKYIEEAPESTALEVAEKVVSSLNRLGSQVFALSPFSQYFDDWLVNLRQILAEFEANSAIDADEEFVRVRFQGLADVERELADLRLKESVLEKNASALAANNHLLVQLDVDYANKTREVGAKRNAEVGSITKKVHDLERELEAMELTGASRFNPFARKAKAQKEAEVTQKLNTTKKELEISVQNFTVEQDRLHDEYERRKQEVTAKVQSLEKEIEGIETDVSLQARQTTCNALADAVKALLQRKSSAT